MMSTPFIPPYEVLSNKWLSYEDVCHLKQIEEVLEIYYNSGQFSHSLNFLNLFFDTPYDLYDALALWYEENDLFGVQSSRIRKYEVLLEFGLKYISGEESDDRQKELKEYIAYDLYLRENMKNRASFLYSMETWKDRIHDLLHRESQCHTLFPELSQCNYRELMKILHVEVFENIFDKPVFVIFWYDRRDFLTNNCIVKKVEI